MRFETLAAKAGLEPDAATGAVAPPIYLSTTFERSADGSYPHGFIYARSDNPNRAALERCLAQLEGGAACAAFASGMAAIMTVFQALLPGDHVIAPADAYFGTGKLLREVFCPWGLQVSFVDMADPAQVEAALRPNTRLVFMETPSNPLLRMTDIARVASIARAAGAVSVVDNTWATPVLQRPLELGADIVMHSTTKYLSGHSDVTGGALIARANDAFFQRIRLLQTTGGAIPSPFECWLTLRGVRTLPYRVRAQSESAMKVASFLSCHPAVARVHYPGLPSHAGHDIAAHQMSGFGGMLSFEVKGERDEALVVAAKVQVFTRATSLGGADSLIEHRASVEAPDTTTPQSLLRVSIGLEHPDDLVEDLAQALD